jgi:HlyD family secretion protein
MLRLRLLFVIIFVQLVNTSCSKEEENSLGSGVFEAAEINLSSTNSGEIIKLVAKEGTSLNKGDLIAQIDTIALSFRKQQILANISALRAKLPDTRLDLASMISQLEALKLDKKRITNMLADDAASKKQLDDIETKIEITERNYLSKKKLLNNSSNALLSQIEALESQLALMNYQIGKASIKSPISGTILLNYSEENEFITLGRPIVKIADLTNMTLKAYVGAENLKDLKLNQEVAVYAEYGVSERKNFSGTITWISSISEFTPKTIQTQDERATLVYAVKIKVPNSNNTLKIGMYGGFNLK